MKKIITYTDSSSEHKLIVGSIGLLNAEVDGLKVKFIVKVINITGSLFSANLMGVVDSQTSGTITSGAGHPNIQLIDNIPLKCFEIL
jgi:hypothetical protein